MICDKCVGTTDIADSAVTSAKIGSGQVKNTDIGNNAVTSGKIADGQVFGSDIAAVTIGSSDIADSAVTSSKLAGGAVKLNGPHIVRGDGTSIAPSTTGSDDATCPSGETLTGGGYNGGAFSMQVYFNQPSGTNTWFVAGFNEGTVSRSLYAFAMCVGPSP